MSDAITPMRNLGELLPEGDGPRMMVNLLRFRRGGGSKAYGQYAAAFEKLLLEAGGRFVYRGRVDANLIDDEVWHAVAVVEYPSRAAFIELIESEAYKAIHPLRAEGLEATKLLSTRPFG